MSSVPPTIRGTMWSTSIGPAVVPQSWQVWRSRTLTRLVTADHFQRFVSINEGMGMHPAG